MLFTVPNNWQPPTSFSEGKTLVVSAAHHSAGTMDSHMGDFPICYNEEELPEECLQMAQHDIISEGLAPFTVSEHEPGSTRTTAEGGAEEWSVKTGHQDGTKEGTWAAASKAEGGHTSKEGGKVLAPPPISITSDQWCVPSPFFHPEQLELVFDLRRQMADQAYHGTLMSQRIDMLYEAFSNAPTKQRCPMCVRLYALPAWNEMPSEDLDH